MAPQAIIAELTTCYPPSAPPITTALTLPPLHQQPPTTTTTTTTLSPAYTLTPIQKNLTLTAFTLLLLVALTMLLDHHRFTRPLKLPPWLKSFSRISSIVEKTACLSYLSQRMLYYILTATTPEPNPPHPLLSSWTALEPLLQLFTAVVLFLAVIPALLLKRCHGSPLPIPDPDDDDEAAFDPLPKPCRAQKKRVSFSDILEVHYYDQTQPKSVSFDNVLRVWHYEQV